jgi:hypothetical protein
MLQPELIRLCEPVLVFGWICMWNLSFFHIEMLASSTGPPVPSNIQGSPGLS